MTAGRERRFEFLSPEAFPDAAPGLLTNFGHFDLSSDDMRRLASLSLVAILLACGSAKRDVSHLSRSSRDVRAAFANAGEPLQVVHAENPHPGDPAVFAAQDPADKTSLTVFVYRRLYTRPSKRTYCSGTPPCRVGLRFENIQVLFTPSDEAAAKRINRAVAALRHA